MHGAADATRSRLGLIFTTDPALSGHPGTVCAQTALERYPNAALGQSKGYSQERSEAGAKHTHALCKAHARRVAARHRDAAVAQGLRTPDGVCEDACLLPSLAHWVKNLALLQAVA